MNASESTAFAPTWVPQRRFTSLVLLVAGVASMAVALAPLPSPVLVSLAAAWAAIVVVAAQASVGPGWLTGVSCIVKAGTLLLVALLLFDRTSPFAPASGLDWIPLGLANMGSGLWFLRLIRGRAA
ncbi:hypothetical protein [Frondihabitans australicus]|uniref:Uncharacterized protein n=1 Tax=Frondihabitans australicus TaxID=386892 RepID=A0A495IGU8_9MICO|nr:hypothetical protein [Frondihabitans australicus]RKR75243.1 hypothetical protein C8E83_2381 [Frondihabitans australicus]